MEGAIEIQVYKLHGMVRNDQTEDEAMLWPHNHNPDKELTTVHNRMDSKKHPKAIEIILPGPQGGKRMEIVLALLRLYPLQG
ncbi:unnamed protein product [Caretta caretta]